MVTLCGTFHMMAANGENVTLPLFLSEATIPVKVPVTAGPRRNCL